MPEPSPMRRIGSATWRRAVLALHASLILGLCLAAGTVGVLLGLPLLLPLPGLWRGTPYTYAAFSLLLVFYAGGLLLEALASRSQLLAALAAVAALEFCALLLFVRVRAAEQRSGIA